MSHNFRGGAEGFDFISELSCPLLQKKKKSEANLLSHEASLLLLPLTESVLK